MSSNSTRSARSNRIKPAQRYEYADEFKELLPDGKKITSRFDGVIKKLHYEAEDVAQVGKVGLFNLLFCAYNEEQIASL